VRQNGNDSQRVITVELPNVFCSATNPHPRVRIEKSCRTVADALREAGSKSPGSLDRIIDESGAVRRHVNVFLNDENIRFLDGLETAVPADATIFVLAAVSGG
jgi:molybdopterin converting factor small subunit